MIDIKLPNTSKSQEKLFKIFYDVEIEYEINRFDHFKYEGVISIHKKANLKMLKCFSKVYNILRNENGFITSFVGALLLVSHFKKKGE